MSDSAIQIEVDQPGDFIRSATIREVAPGVYLLAVRVSRSDYGFSVVPVEGSPNDSEIRIYNTGDDRNPENVRLAVVTIRGLSMIGRQSIAQLEDWCFDVVIFPAVDEGTEPEAEWRAGA
jgi:hypothetical protein